MCAPWTFILNANADSKLPSIDSLGGKNQEHLYKARMPWSESYYAMNSETAEAFLKLLKDASSAGIKIRIASGFRSFERQRRIWNGKANGRRAVYDDHGKKLRIDKLDEKELLFAILRWSALPGASRHHWGTDIDVYDGAAIPKNYSVQLSAEEAYGTFSKLHKWLDERIDNDEAYGFYRPYDGRGGIGAEPWHLSYRPVAERFARYMTKERIRELIEGEEIALSKYILKYFDDIYDGYIAPYID